MSQALIFEPVLAMRLLPLIVWSVSYTHMTAPTQRNV